MTWSHSAAASSPAPPPSCAATPSTPTPFPPSPARSAAPIATSSSTAPSWRSDHQRGRPHRHLIYQLVAYPLIDEDSLAIYNVGFYLPRSAAFLAGSLHEMLTEPAGRPITLAELRAMSVVSDSYFDERMTGSRTAVPDRCFATP
jgi:hypothetical protein